MWAEYVSAHIKNPTRLNELFPEFLWVGCEEGFFVSAFYTVLSVLGNIESHVRTLMDFSVPSLLPQALPGSSDLLTQPS